MTSAHVRAEDFAFTAAAYFSDLQARICAAFEAFEPTARFERKTWSKPEGHRLQGGGQMRIMRGDVFEKVGVNVSHVWGAFSPQHARVDGQATSGAPATRAGVQAHAPAGSPQADRAMAASQVAANRAVPASQAHDSSVGLTAKPSEAGFIAAGISLVAHMVNPFVPAVHMNLRFLRTNDEWFGGGSDLTPTFPFDEDTADFHAALKAPCEDYRPGAYQEFKEWCDRYFYLPHRKEPRGVGGIFFDELASGDRNADFAFVRGVGEAFLSVYPQLVERRRNTPYTPADRDSLLLKRGRYVEFNLVYDRGTKFGFGTDADPEAYLMSLPPLVRW
jgi:coproporphyrinogen III oxidase